MSTVEVLGRDAAREAYRVRTEAGTALVPEVLMQDLRPGERPSHQEAYEWIARHRREIARAVAALASGAEPRAPFEIVTLERGA
ncbi:hypothetical protein LR948_03230 [Roseivivax sp. GX 12232]|uniref:hypothetical protein n=1 Tax=Roseivivax sp. GX 12232 TaxID=2900547 RepID=UPI001E3811EE|nr:hypothetical protein [Roseivivax sp. GX 12232]MCE0504356.1 hypothetical protein [Roseivivax sp. GX 12232]